MHSGHGILSPQKLGHDPKKTMAISINPLTRPGKHTKNNGKPAVLMGKLTISMAMFNSELLVYQRV